MSLSNVEHTSDGGASEPGVLLDADLTSAQLDTATPIGQISGLAFVVVSIPVEEIATADPRMVGDIVLQAAEEAAD